jgi:type IV secretory pathway VirB9-like protein
MNIKKFIAKFMNLTKYGKPSIRKVTSATEIPVKLVNTIITPEVKSEDKSQDKVIHVRITLFIKPEETQKNTSLRPLTKAETTYDLVKQNK